MRVAMQGLMDREGAVHSTAPEKENTLLTMDAAKAMNEMPKTTDSSSLKPPLISSLFRARKLQQLYYIINQKIFLRIIYPLRYPHFHRVRLAPFGQLWLTVSLICRSIP
jgi:hypothetical protein